VSLWLRTGDQLKIENSSAQSGIFTQTLQRIVDVKEEEIRALVISCTYFFFLLSSYYILRPIRDEVGVQSGVKNLPWLFTGTLTVTLLANSLFSTLVAKLTAKRFISITYRFFITNLLIFYGLLLLASKAQNIWVGRAFFVWTSVFNLFVLSTFWAFMADIYRTDQAKRLFGFIGLGGTLGSVVGAGLTAFLAEKIGTGNLILVSVLLLEISAQCVSRLPATTRNPEEGEQGQTDKEPPIGGGILAGISHTASSPYLVGICVFLLLYTIGSTFLYFQQATIVEQNISDRAARTAFLGKIDLIVNTLTILTQLFLTGRIMKLLGVGITLALLPILSLLGFASLGAMPTLAVLVGFQVLRRAGNFAVERPAREVLFTVIKREDKYKAKNFIDTFVYRGGDQIGAWSYTLMGWLGLSMSGIAFAAVPISGLWLLIALWLGHEQATRAGEIRMRAEEREKTTKTQRAQRLGRY
jgi:ATP:ADP antiporter, AAA family